VLERDSRRVQEHLNRTSSPTWPKYLSWAPCVPCHDKSNYVSPKRVRDDECRRVGCALSNGRERPRLLRCRGNPPSQKTSPFLVRADVEVGEYGGERKVEHERLFGGGVRLPTALRPLDWRVSRLLTPSDFGLCGQHVGQVWARNSGYYGSPLKYSYMPRETRDK